MSGGWLQGEVVEGSRSDNSITEIKSMSGLEVKTLLQKPRGRVEGREVKTLLQKPRGRV